VRQDPDVLDTWFSSGLWPFSTLGWPDKTPELRMFYPTSLLSTGYDILRFWVARMAMLGIHLTGEVPFRDVYFHTLIRDPEGQKMSKTKGNVVDPLDLMDKYGTDATRFSLASIAVPSVRDVRIAEERLEASRNFANKLWNASRLVLSNLEGYAPEAGAGAGEGVAERWIRRRLATTVAEVRDALEKYRFNDAASAVYQFLWHEYCDWYLEIAKRSLYQPESPAARAVTQRTLVETLEATLRLLHPFMPFISEELWQRLPHQGDSIMIAPFPKASRKGRDPEAERLMAPVLDFVSAIRTIRSESRISPAVELAVSVKPAGPAVAAALASGAAVIGSLARAAITVSADGARPANSAMAATPSGDVFVRLEGVVDFEAERQRLRKEVERARKEIAFLEGKLGRPDFVERAPAEVVERERARLTEQRQTEQKLAASLAALG